MRVVAQVDPHLLQELPVLYKRLEELCDQLGERSVVLEALEEAKAEAAQATGGTAAQQIAA